MCQACKETRYVHHQHDEDYDEAHEADMRALRKEQLAADIGPEDFEGDLTKCFSCGYGIGSDGSCLCSEDDRTLDELEAMFDDDEEYPEPWKCETCTTVNDPGAMMCQCCGRKV